MRLKCRLIIGLLLSLILSVSSVSGQSTTWLTPEYIGLIQQKIDTYFTYPLEAQSNGWEGIVKVKFTLTADGRIKDIDIAESSGYPLLDAAAILAIKDASPYPAPASTAAKGEELEIIVPVRYEQLPAPPLAQEKTDTTQQKPISLSRENQPAFIESPKPAGGVPGSISYASQLPPSGQQPGQQKAGSLELSYFLNLALQNNQPTKIAQEEVEMANLKVIEARRNFFPTLKIQAYNTNGQVYKVDYTEREARAEINQPVFYGSRLNDTVKQAQANLDMTRKNYDRLKADVLQKSEVAYYNLITAKMHYREKEALLKEAGELVERIRKLGAMNVIIPLEVEGAANLYDQIQLQLDAVKHDLFMAELALRQVLNVKEAPRIDAQALEAKKVNLNLDHCLDLALKNRPEIFLSEMLVKFNDYGKRVENAKANGFTVDFTSYYGSYEGAYKGEKMQHSENWYLGLKASKPLGGSTLNASYTDEHSQPRFGQTSPTQSSTVSADFSILDNLKRLSENKKSEIDLQRSLSDFNETLKTIKFEVQDAFLNYQKTLLQFSTAEADMKFRRMQAEVAKVRALAGETSITSALEALYNLSEAQSNYIKSLGSYHISLANLKKATGYGLKI